MRKLKIFVAGLGQTADPDAALAEAKAVCGKYDYEVVNGTNGFWDVRFAIKDCDVVVADMTPNRGLLKTGETETEIGFASMVNKKIYGYVTGPSDFGSVSPLVYSAVTMIEGNFEDCIRVLG